MDTTTNFTVSIPDEKLQEIKNLCSTWPQKKFSSKSQLQSRFFLNRLLQTLRDHHKKNSITLSEDFHRDIAWFNAFLEKFNGISFFKKQKIDDSIHLDACLTGMGAVFSE